MQEGGHPRRRTPTPQADQTRQPANNSAYQGNVPGMQNTGYAYPYAGQQQQQSGWSANMSAPRPMIRNTYSGSNGYIPPDTYHRVMSQQPDKKRKKKKKKRIWQKILIFILLLASAAVAAVMIHEQRLERLQAQQVAAYDGIYVQGVSVDGIDLSGMTAQEGYDAVLAQAQSQKDAWEVSLSFDGNTLVTLHAADLGMEIDVNETMQEAWRKGHTGSNEARLAEMNALKEEPWQGYTALPSSNTARLDSILSQLKAMVERNAQDAELIAFNPELAYPFEFQEEVVGYRLDTSALKTQLYQMVSTMTSGTLELQPEEVRPLVTVEALKTKLAIRASVYTPISKDSTENRTNNIRRCFEKINGYVLGDGKSFSFNSVVGQRTLQNGFYEAIEYAYGEHVLGVGGGSCQASTTLYQAALTAGLTIKDRSPHSDAVSYTAYGEDATVYWAGTRKIDLVFTNTSGSNIYIVAKVETDPSNRSRLIARCTMYGADLGDTRYELYTEEIEVLPIPEDPEYRRDTNAQYVRYTDQEYTASKGKEGHVVVSYRITYVDGVETSRKQLYKDTYKAQPVVIYRGVTRRE